jgi:putative transposase
MSKKRLRPKGSGIGKKLVFPDLIRGLKLPAPNQVWATDITIIKLMKEFVYLGAVIDIYTRQIVGWAVSRNLSHEFYLKSLDIAVKRRKPPRGIIHHSDRGAQHVSEPFEEVYFKDYQTMTDGIKNLPRFIDEVYNTKRLHSSLGYKTPNKFAEAKSKLKPADRPVQKIWGYAV